jgi:hypothetical protein
LGRSTKTGSNLLPKRSKFINIVLLVKEPQGDMKEE